MLLPVERCLGKLLAVFCALKVIVNIVLTGTQEFPCSSFHTWTLLYLQQFTEFKNVQETVAEAAKRKC